MRTMLAGLVLLSAAGCVSMEDVRSDRTGGTTETYEGSRETILKATVAVLQRQGVEAIERDAAGGMVFGTIPESFLGDVSSTYCGVWIADASDGAVEVRVVTRRRRSFSLLTGLTESTFHAELQRELAGARDIDVRLMGK